MNATTAYYNHVSGKPNSGSADQIAYQQNDNGWVPGITWVGSDSNNYRAIVTLINLSSYTNQVASYDYIVQINPGGNYWLTIKSSAIVINNSNYVNISTGKFVDDPSSVDISDTSTYMPQFDYFVWLFGKNVPGVVIAMYQLFLIDICRIENLTLTS